MQRLELHKGRGSAEHLDNAEARAHNDNIDSSRTHLNVCRRWGGDRYENNLQAEHAYYHKKYGKFFNALNDNKIKQGHKDRVCAEEEYYKMTRYAPTETIYQVGTYDNTIDGALLLEVFKKQMEWQHEKYPTVISLDYALHLDEATPHIHLREVYQYHDDRGFWGIGKEQALKEIGVPLPKPDKPEGRYNNRNMTFTADCRAHMQQLCAEYGIELIIIPKEPGKAGLSQMEYKTQQEQAKCDKVIAKRMANEEVIKEQTERYRAEVENHREEISALKEKITECRNTYEMEFKKVENVLDCEDFIEWQKARNADKQRDDEEPSLD